MVAAKLHPFVRSVIPLHPFVKTLAAGVKQVAFSYIHIVVLRGVLRELVFMQNGRKESYRPNAVRPRIGYIGSHTRTVAESRNRAGRDIVCGIYHIHQVTDRVLNLMLATQLTVMHHAFPQIAVTDRSLFERPFVTVRHHQQHRLAASLRNERSESVHRTSFVLPRTFVPIDAMQEIQNRQRLLEITLRHIDIHAAIDILLVAEPLRVDNLRRYGDRVGWPGA